MKTGMVVAGISMASFVLGLRPMRASLKAAEADELDLVALAQRFRDGVERGGDSLLGVLLGHPALLCDFRDQFGLIHV